MINKLERDLLKRVEILERLVGTMDTVNKVKCESCGDTIPDTDGAHRCEGAYSLTAKDGAYICNYCKEKVGHDKYKHWGGECGKQDLNN